MSRIAAPPSPAGCAGLLGREVEAGAWFAALGEPPAPSEEQEALRLAVGLVGASARVIWLPDPASALERITDPGAAQWWRTEEELGARLRAAVTAAHREETVLQAQERLIPAMLEPLEGAAARAFLRLRAPDPALAKVAAGAAARCIVQEYRRRLAGALPDHPFAAKFRLFLAGRWPLVSDGESLSVL
ncbi:MAG: hypothetical protein KatS3mg119_0209 [Rhodothalassiaceae bacterium]|nr:MAG: hypothetical protein KatS3mg119_0209 [Rhodothalassiaceae bacterium]